MARRSRLRLRGGVAVLVLSGASGAVIGYPSRPASAGVAVAPAPLAEVTPVPPLRRTGTSAGSDAGRARTAVDVNGTYVPFRVMAVPVLPGEEIRVRLSGPGGPAGTAGELWHGRAPTEPGVFGLRVAMPAKGDTIHLNLLVLHPAVEVREGGLRGYEIGSYRPRRPDQPASYEPPRGFAAVPPEAEDILASPHFTLGQFLCKQPGSPRYLALSPALLVKLEHLLGVVREAGYAVETLSVMSGFRTPAYNRRIGNTTVYSRHLWGDAADVFLDEDGDGDMDDLNGDGSSDVADARVLAGIAEALDADTATGLLPGGLAAYRQTTAHGPFVHVDARGSRARW